MRHPYIRLTALAALAIATPLLMASHVNITGLFAQTAFSSTAVGISATVDSSAGTEIGRSEHQSLQYRIQSGTAPNVTFKLLVSLDEVNYAVPEVGGTVGVGAITDTNWHCASLSVPVCKAYKVRAVNNSGANTCVVDAIFGSQ